MKYCFFSLRGMEGTRMGWVYRDGEGKEGGDENQ